MVSTPVTTPATSSQPGLPTWRAMSAGTMKMPEPIIDPTTTIVASYRPSPRLNSVSSVVATPPGAAVREFAIETPSELGCRARRTIPAAAEGCKAASTHGLITLTYDIRRQATGGRRQTAGLSGRQGQQ